MKITIYNETSRLDTASIATIGFFDGVHRGHRFLLRQLCDEARQRQLSSMVVTFDRHPRQVLRSDFQPQMLGTLEEKLALLAQTGVDHCVVLPFREQLASLSAQTFMQRVLKEQLGVKALMIGYDNRFGHKRQEGFDDYVQFGKEMGMDVLPSKPLYVGGIGVSSSVVRSFLLEGEVGMAAHCLGYPYTLAGEVVKGFHVGTGMGFPTANLQPKPADKVIPAPGVYAVMVTADGRQWQGMMNIGNRPTFEGTALSLETHIFDFEGNLYGEQLAVSFISRLRSERKFRSASELTAQLMEDAREAKEQIARWQESGDAIFAK